MHYKYVINTDQLIVNKFQKVSHIVIGIFENLK